MNLYDRPQTLLEDRQYSASRSLHENKGVSISDWRRGWLFFRKPLVMALTVVLLGFSAEVFAQPSKLGLAALSRSQAAAWMPREGGYVSKHSTKAERRYNP